MTAKDLINNEIAQNLFKKINVHVHYFFTNVVCNFVNLCKNDKKWNIKYNFCKSSAGIQKYPRLKVHFSQKRIPSICRALELWVNCLFAEYTLLDRQVILLRCETSSSAVAERPRDVSCLSVVIFNSIYTSHRAQSFIIIYFGFRFTNAYNRILFCSVWRTRRWLS